MTRAKGIPNRRHQARRLELTEKIRIRLARRGSFSGLKEMANAAGVALATLKHYFGDRDGVVQAVFAEQAPLGAPHYRKLAAPSQPFSASIQEAAEYISMGLSIPMVTELHAIGLTEGLGHSATGPVYLQSMLEPLLAAVEERLSAHISAGEMRNVDPRSAALSLVSPLFLAHLHQDHLGGSGVRPLDKAAHLAQQVSAFVRAYGLP